MQDAIDLSYEFSKSIEALHILHLNPDIKNDQLLTYFDIVIKYFIKCGLVPIISTSLKGSAREFYIYFSDVPVNVLTQTAERKMFCSKTLNIQGFLDDYDQIGVIKDQWRLNKLLQYDQIIQSNNMRNYANHYFNRLHAFRDNQQTLPNHLFFALDGQQFNTNQDHRQIIAFKLLRQIQNYMHGGLYHARHLQDQQQRIKVALDAIGAIYAKKRKRMVYKIPDYIQKFLSSSGVIEQDQATTDILQQYQSILQRGLVAEFIEFLQTNNSKPVKQYGVSLKDELCGLMVDLSQSSENFILRLMKTIYTKMYGIDLRVKQSRNLQDLCQILGQKQFEILQKQVEIFINKKDTDCKHTTLTHKLSEKDQQTKKQYTIEILKQWACIPELTKDQIYVEIILDENQTIKLPLEFIICNQCGCEIICPHQCIQYVYFEEFTRVKQQLSVFKQSDIRVSKSHTFCSICGEILMEKDHFNEQINQNILDPNKKYSIYKVLFKNVMLYDIKTTSIFNHQQLLKDMILTISPHVKNVLVGRKDDLDYKEQKLQTSFVFVCAYFMNLSGDNLHFSSKSMYQSNKKITDPYDKFMEKVNKALQLVNPMFIINNKDAIQTLINTLQKNPLIGKLFMNCDVLKKLENMQDQNGVVDLIPLYFDEKTLPDLHKADLEQLKYFQIRNMLIAQAIKFQDVQSPAITQFALNQRIQAQSISNKFHQPNPTNSSRFKPFKNKDKDAIFTDIQATTDVNSFNTFFRSKCPEAITQQKQSIGHTFNTKNAKRVCINCGFEDIPDIGSDYRRKYNQQFKQQFYGYYKKQAFVRKQKPPKQDKLQVQYNEQQMIKLAIILELHPIQIVNLCGFDHINYQKIVQQATQSSNNSQSKSQSLERNIMKVVVKNFIQTYFNKQILRQKQYAGNAEGIQELQFITKIQFCWSVFKSRIGRIYDSFVFLIQTMGLSPDNAEVLKKLNAIYKQVNFSRKNAFVLCQVFISKFVCEFIPQLIQINNQDMVYSTLKQMVLRDKFLSINPKDGVLTLISGVKKNTKLDQQSIDQMAGDKDQSQDEKDAEQEGSDDQESDIDPELMNKNGEDYDEE